MRSKFSVLSAIVVSVVFAECAQSAVYSSLMFGSSFGFQDPANVQGLSASGGTGAAVLSVTLACDCLNDPPGIPMVKQSAVDGDVLTTFGSITSNAGAMATVVLSSAPGVPNGNAILMQTYSNSPELCVDCCASRLQPPGGDSIPFHNEAATANGAATYQINMPTVAVWTTNVVAQGGLLPCGPLLTSSGERSVQDEFFVFVALKVGDATTFGSMILGDQQPAFVGFQGSTQQNPDGSVTVNASLTGQQNIAVGQLSIASMGASYNGADMGDFDQSGSIEFCDLIALRELLAQGDIDAGDVGYQFHLDTNADGTLSPSDEDRIKFQLAPIPGDVGLDFYVGLADVAVILSNFELQNATRAQGDLDGDGVVGLGDIAQVTSNWDDGNPANHPECSGS